MELGTALSSPSKCSDLPTIELMLEDSDMPLWDNYGARLILSLTTSDKIFFSGSDPDKFMYSVKTDLDKGETIMRYIWDVEDVSQWLEPINISHLMNILWKQCWRGTCEGEGCDGALLVVMSARRRARARLDLLPRCSVIRVSRVMSVTGGLVTRHHQMPAVRCKHHIRDCWQSWQGPGECVLLRPHLVWCDGETRRPISASHNWQVSSVSSLSDQEAHQWPGDWFNDIPLHTSIHYHRPSPPRMPHIAWWID